MVQKTQWKVESACSYNGLVLQYKPFYSFLLFYDLHNLFPYDNKYSHNSSQEVHQLHYIIHLCCRRYYICEKFQDTNVSWLQYNVWKLLCLQTPCYTKAMFYSAI